MNFKELEQTEFYVYILYCILTALKKKIKYFFVKKV